jgi:two-component system, OmpR family, alkaline phosphatase synthesis response regulator PhoP
MLCDGGHFVMAAADITKALDIAKLNPISLVIIDLESLHLGWSDFCYRLRANEGTAHLPILMLATSQNEMTQMMKLGTRANGFLVKPFEREELLDRVHALLSARKRIQKVILLVEPDPALRDTITDSLRGEGYFVQIVEDEAEVVGIARNSHISLILFDPTSQQQGIETCRLLRAWNETLHVPLLMMVNDEVEIAQLVRLNLGVNDFLVKPFLWEELRACVRALLRGDGRRARKKEATISPKREPIYSEGEILVADTLRIDVDRRRITQGDQQIILGSKLLFDLLVYLVRHRGEVLSRDQLLQQVWCREGELKKRKVDVHVHWLRQKLHDSPGDPKLIQTVPGMGYRFTG